MTNSLKAWLSHGSVAHFRKELGLRPLCFYSIQEGYFLDEGDPNSKRPQGDPNTRLEEVELKWTPLLRKLCNWGTLVGCLRNSDFVHIESFIWMPATQAVLMAKGQQEPGKTRDTCFVHLSFLCTWEWGSRTGRLVGGRRRERDCLQSNFLVLQPDWGEGSERGLSQIDTRTSNWTGRDGTIKITRPESCGS